MVPLGERQTLVLVLFSILAAIVLGVFALVAVQSGRRQDYHEVQPRAYTLRAWWFKLLLALCAVGFATSLFSLPYAAQAGPPRRDAIQVQVKGLQWAWILSKDRLPAGRLIEFNVTAEDVNHGFGIYSPRGVLLGQVQAMPGYMNHLYFRFPAPGVYLVRCMEYCGAYHPDMWIRIHVYRAA
jgi:cytochrome c oxidase subunit 2